MLPSGHFNTGETNGKQAIMEKLLQSMTMRSNGRSSLFALVMACFTSSRSVTFLTIALAFLNGCTPNNSHIVKFYEQINNNKTNMLDDQRACDEGMAQLEADTYQYIASRNDLDESMYDPVQADPDCTVNGRNTDCNSPPASTLEEKIIMAAGCGLEEEEEMECGDEGTDQRVKVDKHWGSDPKVLRMRDALREKGLKGQRPPIFLLPGLASTRLVAWRHKLCNNPLQSDIKAQDNVWLNLHFILQMSTMDPSCYAECLKLGINQTDSDDPLNGCKLRPDEGLDAISSLSLEGVHSKLLMGGTNTVYSWLIQWLSDNMGYDVSSVVGFPYDWRLSPDQMEERDGFLTFMRRRIEAAVQTSGEPGIVVAHSMGNLIFRYFLSWLKVEFTAESYLKILEKEDISPKLEEVLASLKKAERSPYKRRKQVVYLRKMEKESSGNSKFWEKASRKGNDRWHHWIDTHIWTYAGLSAPFLGAVNPLRAAISGETMGLPITTEVAREMEVTFGSTLTISPISSKNAFCDEWDFQSWDEKPKQQGILKESADLECLDDVDATIENYANETHNPWQTFPALKTILHERVDWDTDFPMIEIVQEMCETENFCLKNQSKIAPKEVATGQVFLDFNKLWPEESSPLQAKYEQLKKSFWSTDIPNPLSHTWDRPPIKHVIMAYGADIDTEVSYSYLKRTEPKKKETKPEGMPDLQSILWETEGGLIMQEILKQPKGIFKPKPKKKTIGRGRHLHSGDGSVPYLSLSFAHIWLLYGIRLSSNKESMFSNPLDLIEVSHRPKGGLMWRDGIPQTSTPETYKQDNKDREDTGTSHPHGTKYKPEMHRFHTTYTDPLNGEEHSTTVIEAFGVEHKETTRNYDILAAVFTDVLKWMHNDFDLPDDL